MSLRPRAAALPDAACDPEGALEDEATVHALDRGIAACEALAVDAPPRAERRQLEPDRPARADEPVHDADRRPPVRHRELALEDDVPELPAPPRHAVLELEGDEELIAARVDGTAGPLVDAEPVACVPDHEHGLERNETEHPVSRPGDCDHEQAVVAARPQPGDSAHGVTADAVGDEPFAPRRLVERPAHLRAEADHLRTV